MHKYQQIYEFAASAGAFEGYVYRRSKDDMDSQTLSNWVDNLVEGYHHLPAEVIAECQLACNQTLGRAIKSLITAFGEELELVRKLGGIVKGQLPDSADDFNKRKWFQQKQPLE
ncbi:MAG: hypothetical protein R3274_09505 [Desulfobacterales bacterium]|nr:hypothetical protein [Desulfobacterales bacterium]